MVTPGVVVAVLAQRPAGRPADRAQCLAAGESSEIMMVAEQDVDRFQPQRLGNVREARHAHVRAHLQAGFASDFGHRRLALDGIFVVFQRQFGDLLADPDGRRGLPAPVGVDPQQGLGPKPRGHRVHAVALDVRGQDAALELEDPKAPAVAELRGHRGHRLGRADLAPGVERRSPRPRGSTRWGSLKMTG